MTGAWRREAGFSLTELARRPRRPRSRDGGPCSSSCDRGARRIAGAPRACEAQQSARAALERMAKELREAGYDPTGAGIAPDRDRRAGARGVSVGSRRGRRRRCRRASASRFVLRPGESILRRDAGGGCAAHHQRRQRLTLTYFDRAGLATTDPAAVASIRISDRGRARWARASDADAGRTQKSRRVRRDSASSRAASMGLWGAWPASRAAPGPRSSSRPTPRKRPGSSRSTAWLPEALRYYTPPR